MKYILSCVKGRVTGVIIKQVYDDFKTITKAEQSRIRKTQDIYAIVNADCECDGKPATVYGIGSNVMNAVKNVYNGKKCICSDDINVLISEINQKYIVIHIPFKLLSYYDE